MSKFRTFNFTDTVCNIYREEEEADYTVIFYNHAAAYSISPRKNEMLKLLTISLEEKLPVNITHKALNPEIVEVKPAGK